MCPYTLLIVTTCLAISVPVLTQADTINVSTPVQDQAQAQAQSESDIDDYIPFINPALIESFDWKLLQELSAKGYENIIISPLTVKLVLALLYEGAAGTTENQFQTVLNFPVEKKLLREQFHELLDVLQGDRRDYIINLGTSIFLHHKLRAQQSFNAKAKAAYETNVVPTNFSNPQEASYLINNWVETLTNGKIQKLVNADDIEDAILLVTSALYFKGTWRHPFSKSQNFRGGFHLTPSKVVPVDYMLNNVTKYFYGHSKAMDAQILRIPYQGKKFSMFIILPNSKDGLSRLLTNIDLKMLKRSIHLMDLVTVELIMPKFKFNFDTKFSKLLRDLGLRAMFQSAASFPGIVMGDNSLKLVVSDIIQKAGIEVNEEGSIAFAAIDVHLHNKFGEPDVIFNVSHPFLFFIEEETQGKILFVGKVENPLKTASSTPQPSKFNEDSPSYTTNRHKATTPPPLVAQRPLEIDYSFQQPQYETPGSRFNYFDWELLRYINIYDNVLISPASIKSTLAMVLEGAGGETAREILAALRLPPEPNRRRQILQQLIFSLNESRDTTTLDSSNAVFVSTNYHIVPEYKAKLDYYKAILKSVNFDNPTTAANIINSYVNEATKGLIPEIVTPSNLDSETAVVITNALYFKAVWKNEFDVSTTRTKCFYSSKRNCIHVSMMQVATSVNYRYLDEIHGHAIDLPYADNKHSMLILLPDEKNNFRQFINDVQHHSLARFLSRLELTDIFLELPRFEINYSTELRDTLQRADIKDAFTQNANLSGIVQNKKVQISSIIHKTKIEVNEKGTEAAAATGVLVTPLMGSQTPRIIADHPFLFFIYNVQTRDILFIGILNEPKEVMNVATKTSEFVSLTNRNTFSGLGSNNQGILQVPVPNPYRTNYNQFA